MKARFLGWWRERSLREQRLLLVMAALLAVTILWIGLYMPLRDGLSETRERHQQAVVRLGEVRAQAAALRAVGRAAGQPGALAAIVTQAAGDAGFADATVAPQGDRRVSVSIPSARSASALAFFAGLEHSGLVVERFSARANSDPTLAIDATIARGN